MVLDIILFSENRNFMTFICRISHFLRGSPCIKDTDNVLVVWGEVNGAFSSFHIMLPLPSFQP